MSNLKNLVDVVYRVTIKVTKQEQLWVSIFGGWHSKLETEAEFVGLDSLESWLTEYVNHLTFVPAYNDAEYQHAATEAQRRLTDVLKECDKATLSEYLLDTKSTGVASIAVGNLEISVMPVSIVSYQSDDDDPMNTSSVAVLLSHSGDAGTDFLISGDDLMDLFFKLQSYLGSTFAGNALQGITLGLANFYLDDWEITVNPTDLNPPLVLVEQPLALGIEYTTSHDDVVVQRSIVVSGHTDDIIAAVIAKLQVPEVGFHKAIAGAYLSVNPYGKFDFGEQDSYSYTWETLDGVDHTVNVVFRN